MPLKNIIITIVEARSIPDADWGTSDKSDAYVVVQFGKKKETTHTIKDNTNPVWNESFSFSANLGNEIVFQMYDQDFLKDDCLGGCSLPVPHVDLSVNGRFDQWLHLFDKTNKPAGELRVVIEPEFDDVHVPTTSIPLPSGGSSIQTGKVGQEIEITVVRAQGLANKDLLGKSDPYVILQLGQTKHQTETQKGTTEPVWNQRFPFSIAPGESIQMTVSDSDIGKDDIIGQATLDYKTIFSKFGTEFWVPVTLKGKQTGLVLLAVAQPGVPNAPPQFFPNGFTGVENYSPAISNFPFQTGFFPQSTYSNTITPSFAQTTFPLSNAPTYTYENAPSNFFSHSFFTSLAPNYTSPTTLFNSAPSSTALVPLPPIIDDSFNFAPSFCPCMLPAYNSGIVEPTNYTPFQRTFPALGTPAYTSAYTPPTTSYSEPYYPSLYQSQPAYQGLPAPTTSYSEPYYPSLYQSQPAYQGLPAPSITSPLSFYQPPFSPSVVRKPAYPSFYPSTPVTPYRNYVPPVVPSYSVTRVNPNVYPPRATYQRPWSQGSRSTHSWSSPVLPLRSGYSNSSPYQRRLPSSRVPYATSNWGNSSAYGSLDAADGIMDGRYFGNRIL